MTNLAGTTWVRRSDDAVIRIEDDPNASRVPNRNLLAVNTSTGRHFWTTPEGLSRKYIKFEEMPEKAKWV